MIMLRWVIIGLIGLLSPLAFSKSNSKLWGMVSYFGREEQVLYTIEPQLRLVDKPGTYEESSLNASIGENIFPKWQIWFGQHYINYSNRNDVDEDVNNKVDDEYRIWEQILWNVPFIDQYASRLRLEQRRSFQSSQWGLRIRERAYWMPQLKERWYFILNEEFFVNLKSVPWIKTASFDQNELSIGIFYKFLPKLGLNVSYINQFINKTPSEDNHVLLFNLIKFID